MNKVVRTSLLFSVLFTSLSGFATGSCGEAVKTQIATGWEADLAKLQSLTNSYARQPLSFRGASSLVSISTDPADYKNTKFVVSAKASAEFPEGAQLIEGVELGYSLSDGFRRLGRANYFVVSKDGKILEIGAGSDALLLEIQSHVFSRTLSASSLKTIDEINGKILATLRADPRAQAKVDEFVKKRNWPEGIAQEAQLAYFSEEILPLEKWARDNGYSKKQLRDAGWMLLKFGYNGQPIFQVNYSDSIKIPYFSDATQTKTPIWRTRTLTDRDDGKKYLGWQNDRSISREFTAAETLYNGWKLSKVRGETLVITEGEFKCMISTKASGILSVGIPGITQFDAKLAKAIVAAGPKEVIVVLDRDPIGKGLMRVDGITDSQRAAYSIAVELQKAGGQNIRVGTLPDVFDGSKVGADDLILAKGVQPYLETLSSAVTPQEYAQQISLDEKLHSQIVKRQALGKAIDSYTNVSRRGGEKGESELLARLRSELAKTQAELSQQMSHLYRGARAITQPSARFPSIRMNPSLIESREVVALSRDEKQLELSNFAKDILIMDYVTSDLPLESCRPGPCVSIGLTQKDVNDALAGRASEKMTKDIERGQKVLREAGFEPITKGDLTSALLAGKLAHEFPLDEYTFDFNLKVGSQMVPIVIYKKSGGAAVGFARLRISPFEVLREPDLFQKVHGSLRR